MTTSQQGAAAAPGLSRQQRPSGNGGGQPGSGDYSIPSRGGVQRGGPSGGCWNCVKWPHSVM